MVVNIAAIAMLCLGFLGVYIAISEFRKKFSRNNLWLVIGVIMAIVSFSISVAMIHMIGPIIMIIR